MMQRKGQLTVALILAIAFGIVVLIVGIALGFRVLFSSNYAFYTMGIGIIVLTFIYAVPALLAGSVTRQKRNFVLVLFLVGAAFILIPLTGITKNTAFGGFDYINVPTIG